MTLASASRQAKPCRVLSDPDWLQLNLTRVPESSQSGRGLLQKHAPRFDFSPGPSTCFQTLDSERRLEFLRHVNGPFLATATVSSRLEALPERAP